MVCAGCRVAEMPTLLNLHGPKYMLVDLGVGEDWPGYPDRRLHFSAEFAVQSVCAFALHH